jgi:hypothetical protein
MYTLLSFGQAGNEMVQQTTTSMGNRDGVLVTRLLWSQQRMPRGACLTSQEVAYPSGKWKTIALRELAGREELALHVNRDPSEVCRGRC